MPKKKISFVLRLDENLWEKFTIKCIRNRTSKSEILTKYIEEYVSEG